jgi:hypothetical protein
MIIEFAILYAVFAVIIPAALYRLYRHPEWDLE